MKTALAITALLLVAGASGACATSTSEEDIEQDEGMVNASTFKIYGKDRVGDLLDKPGAKIPADLPAFEKMFKIGRSCARKDSKEIFVVEESQTRLAGPRELHEKTETKLMPRAVITGCNDGDLSDSNSIKKSTSLFAALISDPSQPGADKGDTIRTWPLEVMALDRETGLYNFYVFEPVNMPADFGPVKEGTPGRVTRVYRAVQETGANKGKFNVFQIRKTDDAAPTAPVQPIGGGNRCFNCHVNGAPLMNELRDPWTNWVSFKNSITHSTMSGGTLEIVGEAVPNSAKQTSSLANDLEPIMRAATTDYVNGSTRTNGWARKTLAGELPGGLPKMFESVFCQTELNYGSSSQVLPLELYFDPDAANPAGLVPPNAFGSSTLPFLLPIRSMRDKDTENWLVAKGYLENATAMAIRLVDDENDIYSPARCDLHAAATKDLPTDPKAVHEKVRDFLAGKVDGMPWAKAQPARAEYMRQLLRPGVRREKAQRDYLAEMGKRYEAMPKTEQAVKAKERFRKARAREQFGGRSNPLPILDQK